MKTQRERNQRILQMRQSGATYGEISQAFGLSKQAVGVIPQGFEAEKETLRRSIEMLERIREADDPHRKWIVADLLDALGLLTMTRNAIANFFKWAERKEISLLDLMDLAVSDKSDRRPGYVIAPLLDLRCVGKTGFWSVVKRLTELDLGERTNQEWRKRLARLKECSRIRGGGQYSWSKPFEFPPGWKREPSESTPCSTSNDPAAPVEKLGQETKEKRLIN